MFCHCPRVLIKVRRGPPVVADVAIYVVTLSILLPKGCPGWYGRGRLCIGEGHLGLFLNAASVYTTVLLLYLPSLPNRTLPVERVRLVLSWDLRIMPSLRSLA